MLLKKIHNSKDFDCQGEQENRRKGEREKGRMDRLSLLSWQNFHLRRKDYS